jgi:hypothetical protein
MELFLLLLVPEAVLLLALTLVVGVIPVVVVVLVGGVELLPLRAVSDEVGGVTALEAALRRPPPFLAECATRKTFSPAGQSRHRGCSRTAHQKLHTKKINQTSKQTSQ